MERARPIQTDVGRLGVQAILGSQVICHCATSAGASRVRRIFAVLYALELVFRFAGRIAVTDIGPINWQNGPEAAGREGRLAADSANLCETLAFFTHERVAAAKKTEVVSVRVPPDVKAALKWTVDGACAQNRVAEG